MIGKAPATGSGFKGLINYLMLGKLGAEDTDRVAWSDARNLAVDDPHMARRIMKATASQSTRCEKPVYHLVVAWHKDENPTEDQMRQVGDTTIEDLELSDHQAILIAHNDTNHRHLHIVVNRVHPETGVAWERWKDWPRIEKSLGRQALQLGMRFVPGPHNTPEAFRDAPRNVKTSEYQMAVRLGTVDQLRPRWSKAQIVEKRSRLAETFDQSASWDELVRALAQDGITLQRKGQGIILGDDTGTMKLSDLKREIRLPALEARFGGSWADFDQRREQEPVVEPTPAAATDSSADDQAAPISAAPVAPKLKVPPPEGESAETEAAPKPSVEPQDVLRANRLAAASSAALTPPKVRDLTRSVEPSRRPERIEPEAPPLSAEAKAAFAARWKERAAEALAKKKDKETEKRAAEEERACERYERERAALSPPLALPKEAPPPQLPPPGPEPQQRKVPAAPTAEALKKAQAYDAQAKVEAEADLAHRMYRAGLITRKQLARSLRERDVARGATEQHKPIEKKLAGDIRKALAPDHTKPDKGPPDRGAPASSNKPNKDRER